MLNYWFHPTFATRRRLKAGLVIAGALAGFGLGIVLTRLGKIVAGAPPATLENYIWNAVGFALLAAICSPIITWSFLQRAPLWRTILEPSLWAAAGAAIAVTLGLPSLVLLLPPVGIVLGVLNLRRRYPANLERVSGGSHSPEQDSAGTVSAELDRPKT